MNVRWRKVGADFCVYRLQIGLIALVLAVGAAGVVATLNAKAVLGRAITASFADSNPPDLALWFDAIDSELLAGLAAQLDVAAVEARRIAYSRIAVADGDWLALRLTIVRNVAQMQLARAHFHDPELARVNADRLSDRPSDPLSDRLSNPNAASSANASASVTANANANGAADDRTNDHAAGTEGIWIEQSGAELLPEHGRQLLRIRTPGGGTASLAMTGLIHDPGVAPSTQERVIYAVITPATARRLGQNEKPDQVLIKMTRRAGASDALELGNTLAAWAKAQGHPALRVDVLADAHPHAALMNALLRMLNVLAAIAFTSSAALATYLVSLWMKREVRVVGIMKTIGARSHQIAAQYLALVGPVAVVETAVALPLGSVLGRALARYYAGSLNIDINDWHVPPALQAMELSLALCIPLLAMAAPIARATRMGARAAISDEGIIAPRNRLRLGHLIFVPGSRRWTLALRNTFRRPWRLTLIVVALASGGALLLTTHSNYESLMRVIDRGLAQQGHDVEVVMQRPAPAAQLEAIGRSVAGVARAEAWRRTTVAIEEHVDAKRGEPHGDRGGDVATRNIGRGSGNLDLARIEGKRFALTAYPPRTALFRRPILEGRAIADAARDEVLMTRTMREAYPGLAVGGAVVLGYRDRSVPVRVVGLIEEIGAPALYTNFETYDMVTGLGDAATSLRIKAGAVALAPLAASLDQALLDAHLTPSQVMTRDLVRDSLHEHLKVVGDVIRLVALAAALVGAIVLAASTASNVLERTREIGVLRALGAAPAMIAAIFLAEGAAVALLSALLAIALSIGLTLVLNAAAARTLLHVAVPLHFSLTGLAILVGGVLVLLAAVALSVRRVFRLSARAALAYE